MSGSGGRCVPRNKEIKQIKLLIYYKAELRYIVQQFHVCAFAYGSPVQRRGLV
jgi:hypothetical protein